MFPLIEITTIPIELEMKVNNAKLEYLRGTAEVEVTQEDGGLSIKSRPIRLNIDTFEARNSVSPSFASTLQENAKEGHQAAYEATATYAQQGKLLLSARIGQEMITQFAQDAVAKDIKPNVGIKFIPTQDAEITWDEGELNIRYEMDKLNFDWRTSQPSFDFTPGDIQISVVRQPDIIIKYIGGMIYVPPSADPNYVPVDVHA
ncbi:MAG: hypothetical protein H6Q61_452 [Firmicutes bacterium]|nr:hypothetical protein [Bacillota bacterium]